MSEMFETYELTLKIMRFFDDYDPWSAGSDMFEEIHQSTVEMLLNGEKQFLIDQINDCDLETADELYDDAIALIAELEKYEAPDIWWKD